MAVGPDLPGPEQETDGENHVLKHTAFLALLRLGWLWGAKGPQAQALHQTARGCKRSWLWKLSLAILWGSIGEAWTPSQ